MPAKCRQKYFSLIEILIVVSILAILATLASSSLGSSLGIIKEEELKEKLIALVNSSRLTAQVQGAKQSITFSKNDGQKWQVEIVTAQETTEFTIPQDQREQALSTWDPKAFNGEETLTLNKDWLLLDKEQNPISEEFNIHFYPDGQSSGDSIYLQTGENGRIFNLSVDRLTSRMTWQEEK